MTSLTADSGGLQNTRGREGKRVAHKKEAVEKADAYNHFCQAPVYISVMNHK